MKIAIGSDHGAYHLKGVVKTHLEAKGFTVEDFGTHSTDSCDYPDFGEKVAKAVAKGDFHRGIVLCTTGIGISITANKVAGIRCALCTNTLMASLTRQHNDSNVLALGAGITGELLSLEIVDTWLETAFEGGRHQGRIDKITQIETA